MIAILKDHACPFNAHEDRGLERRVLNYLRLRLPIATAVEVEIQNGTAVLRGVVASGSIQWRCRECCRYVAGVLNVIDLVVVLPSHSHQNFIERSSADAR